MNENDLKGRAPARRIKLNTQPKGSKPAVMAKEPEVVGYIDMTPTWRAILPVIMEGLTNGTPAGQEIARQELARMADAADRWNAHCKAQREQEGKDNG